MARNRIGARKIAPINADMVEGSGRWDPPGGLNIPALEQQAAGPRPLGFSFTAGALTYIQNFNTLAQSGTGAAVPTDWFFVESPGDTNYSAGTGSSTTGDTYSFGSAATPSDRAFGQLRTGTVVSTIGAQFWNTVGGTIISALSIAYTGEQWRLGATGRVDRMDFQISFDATSLSNGTWYDINALDFTAPVTAGTVGALDGNAGANSTAISATLSNLSIAPSTSFWIRWVDFDATGADDGLAIDDFSIGVVNVAPTAMIQQTIAASSLVSPPGNHGREFAALTVLSGGGYVVAWDSTESDADGAGVMAQRYDSSGAALGGATLINTTTPGFQGFAALASTSGGGYVVAWQSVGQDGSGTGIYAQRFDANGVAQGVETRVNTTVTNAQEQPAMVGLAGGGYVITWDGNGPGDTQGIFAQRYDANGVPQGGEVRVNSTTVLNQNYPAIAALAGGGYVITWQSSDSSSSGVFAQRYNASGVAQGSETLVNTTTTGDQYSPAIAALGDGGYVIVWSGQGFGEFSGIFGQRFNASGVAQGNEFSINAWSSASEQAPSVAGLANGEFVVTWNANSALMGRRFAADGTALGPSFQLAASAYVTFGAAISGFADGGYGVAWDTGDILLTRYATTLSATEQASTSLKGAIVVGDADSANGSITVTLSVAYGILNATPGTSGAVVSGSGTGTVVLTGTLSQIQGLLVSNGTSTVTYTPHTDAPPASTQLSVTVNDGGNSGSGGPLSATSTTTINIAAVNDAPTAAPDAFTITEAGTISGGNLFADNGSGADTDPDGPALTVAAVNGSGANVGQQLTLASGALLTVRADGTFDYNPNHVFDATPAPGSGASNTSAHDSFTYTVTGGNTVTVTLTVNGLDTDDILRGTPGADFLDGGAGNDFLVGGAGNDVMVGGVGDDTYYVNDSGDVIGEQAGEGHDRVAATITLALAADADIERLDVEDLTSTNAIDLTGSAIANTIYGNDGVNVLRGEAGNDELRGFGGDDFLAGGPGTDLMVGGLGDDTFYVDDASDAIGEIAGQGNDRIAASVSFVLSNGADVELLEAVNVASTDAFDLTGSDSNNTITGNAGVNILRGEGGDDILSGAGGDDFMVGGAGNDVMNGGTGNDTYYVDAAGDVVNEFAGEGSADRVVVAVTYALSANADVELLETATQAGTGAIDLTGSSVANLINGNNGANWLDGKGGSDTLTGFGGADTFAFTTALGAGNIDRIIDFVTGTDKVALDDTVFAAIGPAGALNANAFFAGAAAHDADDRIIYNTATGALLYDADGSGAGAAVQFATLQSGLNLTAGDFQVI